MIQKRYKPVMPTAFQSETQSPSNEPLKFNILWYQHVYDIEHLNSQSESDFAMVGPITVASPMLRYSQ